MTLNPRIPRLQWSATERKLRSRIAQMVVGQGFLRGTLQPRLLTCGEPSCRCARGQLHSALYLIQVHQGKRRQVSVPKAWQKRIQEAVSNYRQLQQLLEEVSELEWQRLRERKR